MGIKAGLVSGSLFSTLLAASVSAAPIEPTLRDLVQQSTSADRNVAKTAISNLRQEGYPAIQAFVETYKTELNTQPQLRAVLDRICQQKDCDTSRLYWYTDLEQAKAAARLTGKPILSLHLLGHLSEEFSCANSRFFRTVLYPNTQVSQFLRDRFILHWQSVRPVPKVTIDFGDGRKLERTLTGNSIHYILDSAGRPVEALPGLYGPQAFLQHLQQAEQIVRSVENLSNTERQDFLAKYHRDRLNTLEANWQKDLKNLNLPTQPLLENSIVAPQLPSAEFAGRLAISKSAVETPILRSTAAAPVSEPKTAKLDEVSWKRLAINYLPTARLDGNSRNLIRRQLGNNISYRSVVTNFENLIAEDTIRNEYTLHAVIHQWFANKALPTNDLKTLNDFVYADLFLTPSSDPWLGLLPRNVYTGLEAKSEFGN